MVIDTIFVCDFVDPDMGFEIFFERGQQNKRALGLEIDLPGGGVHTETQSWKVADIYNSNLGIIVSKHFWKALRKLSVGSTVLGFTWGWTISEVLSLWTV